MQIEWHIQDRNMNYGKLVLHLDSNHMDVSRSF